MSRELVIVLGAEGFIGRAIRRRIGDRYRVVCVDKEPPTEVGANERRLQLDMGKAGDIDALFSALGGEPQRVAGVLDLVAYYDFKNEPDERYGEIEEGLGVLLERCGRDLPADAPFVYASSMAALEPTEPGTKLGPDAPRSGAWAYTAHKVRCEQILEAADVPQPRVELVLAGVYSAWCELVPLYQQIERVRRASIERHFYPGPVDRGFPYVHVDDAAAAFEAAVTRCRGRSGVHRYMVGEDEPVTYRKVQDVAARTIHGAGGGIRRVPKFVARQGARMMGGLAQLKGDRAFIQPWMIDYAGEHFELDTDATRAELGWSPRHDMHAELPDICARARDNPEEWRRRNDARPF
jgi:nucleoside-diphosphate-sugar epimerase